MATWPPGKVTPKFKVGDEVEPKPDVSGYISRGDGVKRFITAIGENSYLYTSNGLEYQEAFTVAERNFQKVVPFWETGKTYAYGRDSIFFEPVYIEKDGNGDRVAIGRERIGLTGRTCWTVRRQFDPGTWRTE